MSKPSKELPVMLFEDKAAFEQWLERNHETSPGIWLRIAKKGSGMVSVTYAEALEIALCYGWVDSQKEKLDEQSWLQRFTPRSPKSVWSQVNKEKVEQLLALNRMKPAGMRAVEAARQNGQWDKAYAPQSKATMPDDFAAELERHEKAKAFYESLNRQNQYAILYRIHNAKKPETRLKRIRSFIEMLENGEKLYP